MGALPSGVLSLLLSGLRMSWSMDLVARRV